MISAYHDFEEVARILLKYGCNIDHKDCVSSTQFGKRAIDRAKNSGMAQLLMNAKGASNDIKPLPVPQPTAPAVETPPYIQTTVPPTRSNIARNTSPSTRSITPDRRLSSSSTPRRNIHPASVHHSVTKQLYTADQRKLFREEMDRYIKASVTTLGSALAQECLATMQSALAEELKAAEDRLRGDLEGGFRQNSKELTRKMREFVGRLIETPTQKQRPAVSDEDEIPFKSKRKSVKYAVPESPVKVYDELLRIPSEREATLRLSANPQNLQVELQDFVDQMVADMGSKLQEICRQAALKEVKAKVGRVQELLASEVEESVGDMGRTMQRRLELFAQARARESARTDPRKQALRASGSASQLQEQSRRKQEAASLSQDEEEELAREYLRIPLRDSSEPASMMTPSSSVASVEVSRLQGKPSPAKGKSLRSLEA